MSVGRLGFKLVNSAAFNLEKFLAEWPLARGRTWRVRAVLPENAIHASAWCARARRLCCTQCPAIFQRVMPELCQCCAWGTRTPTRTRGWRVRVDWQIFNPRVSVHDACASMSFWGHPRVRVECAYAWPCFHPKVDFWVLKAKFHTSKPPISPFMS